jgi:iron complex transport system ATP-binding protein
MPDPELLLLDEPAAGLDLGGREDLLRRLSAFALDPASPATVMVTHHLEEIPSSTTHILILKAGSVFAQGEIGIVLTSESLSALYESEILLENRGGRYFAHAR